jgi:drug/metabolite transporter (DMT)-like permease
MLFVARSYRAALFQMHAATVLFGLSAIFGRLISRSAAVLVCGRALFAVVFLGLVCGALRDRPWQGVSRRALAGLALSGVLLTAHYVAFFIGIKLGGVAVGALGFACFPAFTTLCEAVFFKERPTAREYLLMLLVTIGLVLIAPSLSLRDTATVGLLWGVASGAIYAVLAVANRRLSADDVPGVKASWWQNLVIVACLLPGTAEGLAAATAWDWLWIGCLGVFCTGVAYTLYVSSLTMLKARLAALIIALEPVYAILAAWLLLHDAPGLRTVCGGILIIGAVVWSGRR